MLRFQGVSRVLPYQGTREDGAQGNGGAGPVLDCPAKEKPRRLTGASRCVSS